MPNRQKGDPVSALYGLLGVSGADTTGATVNQLMEMAAEIFQIDGASSPSEMVAAIRKIALKDRAGLRRQWRALFDDSTPPVIQPIKPVAKSEKQRAAPSERAIREFYDSWEWKRLSYDIKLERGRMCECCGAAAPHVRIHTDHVKPIRFYWQLRLVRENLQILCEDCNRGKGSRDETDFRPQV